jgi:hypothetical protein
MCNVHCDNLQESEMSPVLFGNNEGTAPSMDQRAALDRRRCTRASAILRSKEEIGATWIATSKSTDTLRSQVAERVIETGLL